MYAEVNNKLNYNKGITSNSYQSNNNYSSSFYQNTQGFPALNSKYVKNSDSSCAILRSQIIFRYTSFFFRMVKSTATYKSFPRNIIFQLICPAFKFL